MVDRLSLIVRPGWFRGYVTHLNGKRFLRSWIRYEGTPTSKSHAFSLLQAVDNEAIGGKGGARVLATLVTDGSFEPKRYRLCGGTAIFDLKIDRKNFAALLPDRRRVEGITDAPELLLIPNGPQTIALSLMLRRHELLTSDVVTLRYFNPGTLLPGTYVLTRTADDRWRSNFDEVLTLGPDGDLQRIDVNAAGATVTVLDERPRRWSNSGLAHRTADAAPEQPRTGLEVELEIKTSARTVAGSILLPAEDASAAALFLAGSGQHDRQGRTGEGLELGYGTLFDGLAASGIAILRYDSPGTGRSPAAPSLDPDYEAVVGVADHAWKMLSTHERTSNLPRFLIGHSQGGLVALEIASSGRPPAGVILLATAGRRLDAILREQLVRRFSQVGLTAEQKAEQLARFDEFVQHVETTATWTAKSVPEAVFARRRERNWYSSILQRDPASLVAKLQCPLLILQGARDVQVSVEDAERLASVARSAGVACELRIYPDLDHLLKRAPPDSDPMLSLADRRRRMDRRVIRTIVSWMDKHRCI